MTLKEFLESKVPNELDSVTGEEAPFEVEKNGYVGAVNADGLLDGEVQKAGPRPQISDIKITTDGTTVPEDNSVQSGTALQITFTHSIEGGTTTVSPELPYTTDGTEMSKEFIITGTVDGQTYTKKVTISVESKYKVPKIADMVEIGDFVDYSAGNWTEADIAKLGDLYAGTSLPKLSTPYQFGGFGVTGGLTMSKDSSITPYSTNENIYTKGWRVLSKNKDGTINIVHAGTPEAYYHKFESASACKSQYILGEGINSRGEGKWDYDSITVRNWSMYEDCSTDAVNTSYAVKGSGRTVTYAELNTNGTMPIRETGAYYWTSTAYTFSSDYSMRFFLPNGERADSRNFGYCYGIRPVVTLKSNVKVTANEGEATHTTPETAWKLSM